MARKTKQEAQETRQHILDVALRLFSQQGVSSTSLGEIAKAAGVTRGAIYWHFKDKSDLFSEIWELSESNIGELELEYQAKFPGDPLSVLMNPLMILVKIIKLRWIHILSYDQMVSRKINNQTTKCANSIFYTTLFTNSAPNYT